MPFNTNFINSTIITNYLQYIFKSNVTSLLHNLLKMTQTCDWVLLFDPKETTNQDNEHVVFLRTTFQTLSTNTYPCLVQTRYSRSWQNQCWNLSASQYCKFMINSYYVISSIVDRIVKNQLRDLGTKCENNNNNILSH